MQVGEVFWPGKGLPSNEPLALRGAPPTPAIGAAKEKDEEMYHHIKK